MCQVFSRQPREEYRSRTRSLTINGQSTSIRLEQMFWRALDRIAASENLSTPQFISQLHSEVMDIHGEAGNFTSLLRCICLNHAAQLLSDQTFVAEIWQSDGIQPQQVSSNTVNQTTGDNACRHTFENTGVGRWQSDLLFSHKSGSTSVDR